MTDKNNLHLYLQKTLKKLLIALTGLLILTQIATLARTEEQIAIEFQEKRDSVQSQIENINRTLDEIIQNQQEVHSQSTTLVQRTIDIREETSRIDNMIFDTRVVIQQVEKEIDKNQTEIDLLSQEIKEILRELQIQRNNNLLKVFLTSENLSEALSTVYQLSSTNDRLEQKRREMEFKNQTLTSNKEQHQAIRDQLERSRSLLRSRESNLSVLLSATEGEESKYQQLISSIENQKRELEAQLGGLDGDYLAEIQALQEVGFQEEYDESASCSFEDTRRLRIPKDYFTAPAKGWLTQPFHCGHDGIDIANAIGTDIYAIADGTVERIGPNNNGCIGLGCNGGFGNYILVKHRLPSDQVVYSLSAHLHTMPNKRIGQEVKRGEVIGKMGCTGYTRPFPCGSHIHFVLLADTYETGGIGCRLGGATCFDPLKYINI